MKIACIGGGNMITAIVAGLTAHGTAGSDITVKDPNAGKRARLKEVYGVDVTDAPGGWITRADIVILGVKPQVLQQALADVAGLISEDATVLSIAAGVTVAALKRWTGSRRIVRAMPNTPAMVSKGFTGFYVSETAGPVDAQRAQTVLSAIGRCARFDSEDDLHTVTAGTGSGPAYVFLFMQGLEEALVAQGAAPAVAHELALATVEGAAALARAGGADFATLRQNVTSRGGTTAKAIEAFEAAGFRQAIDAAVKACAARSREMAALFA